MSGRSAAGDAAAVVVACRDLDRAVDACLGAGFRLDAIGPADRPTWAELSRPGLTLVVDATADPAGSPRLRLPAGDATGWPEDSGMALQPATGPVPGATGAEGAGGRPTVPPTVQTLAIGHEAGGDWKEGRAGMRYRDLIPDRYGGAYIGSHIHIPHGGPVPDYVHHHDIVHQLIFCHRGWVRVVYQDQGPPLVLRPGDCVLQPPGIRHRVLEASDDLFVVEIGCPAVHRTSVDHDLDLPNQALEPARRYGGQHFIHHVADQAPWTPSPSQSSSPPPSPSLAPDAPRAEEQDMGLGWATDGLVTARRVRAAGGGGTGCDLRHEGDFRLIFVTDGAAVLTGPDGTTTALHEGSSATIPAGQAYRVDLDGASVVLDVLAADPHRD